jgi:hypothetical protein
MFEQNVVRMVFGTLNCRVFSTREPFMFIINKYIS